MSVHSAVRRPPEITHIRHSVPGWPVCFARFVSIGDRIGLGGDARRILAGPPLADPPRFRLDSLCEEDDFLFLRYRSASDGR